MLYLCTIKMFNRMAIAFNPMKTFLYIPFLLLLCLTTVAQAQSKYDLNADGNVNVGDVTSLVNAILGKGGTGLDLNADGSVNVGDVTKLVNVILGKTPDDTPTDAAVRAGLCPDANHPHQIDLGEAGTWACCNVGAASPLEYGGYFAWGETMEKEVYSWDEYKYYLGDLNGNGSGDDEEEISDDIGTDICANPLRDAATAQWGEAWQMPNVENTKMLAETCAHEWVTINGINGRKFTATNGNTIFLPAAGYRRDDYVNKDSEQGYYWTGTASADSKTLAYNFTLNSERARHSYDWYLILGHTIRPVAKAPDAAVKAGLCPNNNHPHMIDLGEAGTWACCNVGAKNPLEVGSYFSWGETEEKEVYDWANYKYWTDLNEDHFVADDEVADIGTDISGKAQYDAAVAQWGSPWQMPTYEQFGKLAENSERSVETIGDVVGTKFTASNGQAIFFPITGYLFGERYISNEGKTYFWLATRSNTLKYADYAEIDKTTWRRYNICDRNRGLPIRAIAEE